MNVGEKKTENSSALAAVAERFISLDANDQRYVSLGIIAEMANCPAHGYLLQSALGGGGAAHGNDAMSQEAPANGSNTPCALHGMW